MNDTVEPLTSGESIALANMLNALKGPIKLSCSYRNWKGETRERRFVPIEFWHGSTEYHPDPGLMLKAHDIDKNEERDFRVVDFETHTLLLLEPG